MLAELVVIPVKLQVS